MCVCLFCVYYNCSDAFDYVILSQTLQETRSPLKVLREIVQGVPVNEFSRGKIDAAIKELKEERDAVKELGLI